MAATADPARPLLTWYDDHTGERVELSGATCANWLAKTANLLVDGSGLAGPARAVVDAPPHWQTAVIMLGCWSAGLSVAPPGAVGPEVVFAAADRLSRYADTGAELFALALAPLAAPLRHVPPGATDFVVEVRAYGDHFAPPSPVRPGDPATPEHSHAELCRAAAARAAALGIAPGARVLVDLTAYPDPRDWLLAPLLVGASTVLCAHLDPARLADRTSTERAMMTLPPAR
ncbi:MAG: TIGR03089 family protein [Micromonosporaceae bacterium]|nr:TIGR03089 family protein [Micromonosporaceae bacterium]